MKTPDRRDAELNEVRWWSRWTRTRWRGDGYLLYSGSLREPFFNRAGSLGCRGVSGTAAWAERRLSHLGMSSAVLALESCAGARKLLSSGYRLVDTMTVLVSMWPIRGGGVGRGAAATSPEGWTGAYLRAFYGSEGLAGVVNPIVSSLLKDRRVTLLESRTRRAIVGVLPVFRTAEVAGVYCVGTVPEHRRRGVATGLLAEAGRIAHAEGRPMVLQTLTSEGALQFYLDRGFEIMHSKLVLEKKLI